MKTFLKGAIFSLVLALSFNTAASAAGCNIAQPDTGTEWRCSTPDNSALNIPVGVHHMTIMQELVTTAKTNYILLPLTSSKVTFIHAVLQSRLTGNTNTFRLYNMDSDGNVTSEVTNGTQSLRFTNPGNASGMVTGKVATFTPTGNNTFTQGHVLAIGSEGGATNNGGTGDVLFVITVRPR